MSNEPAAATRDSKTARHSRGRGTRRRWAIDPGRAETVLAGARKALFVMTGVLILLWALQLANYADGYQLTQSYGIRPRDLASLPDILTAPFLHFSWSHIEGNSGPLFIFGFLAAYRGIAKFVTVTVIVVLTSGLAAWFFEAPNTVGAGASGVVFGYFGYIIVRGVFDRHAIDVLVGAVMALCFAYQFAVLLPQQGIGWQAHVGGLLGGIASGWLLRERRVASRETEPAGAARAGDTTEALPAAGNTTPAGRRGGQTSEGKTSEGKTGKGLVVDPSNPRAELYKQLDEMGL